MQRVSSGLIAALTVSALTVTDAAMPAAHAQSAVVSPTKSERLLGPGTDTSLLPSSSQVSAASSPDPAAPGVLVTIQPGQEDYPGVMVKPLGGPWNLAEFGHVEARIVNTGTGPLSLALRVDNAGRWQDNPWDTETVTLPPGATDTITTIFGYSYGRKPGYALKPSAVVDVLLFTGKSSQAQSFRIESLVAGGSSGEAPPVAPQDVRVQPKDGFLVGPGIPVQITSQNTGGARLDAGAVRAVFPAGGPDGPSGASLSPPVGRWDLRDDLEVTVRVRNEGQTPVTPRVRVDSNGGASEWVAGASLAPGSVEEITVPFAGTVPTVLPQSGALDRITSDAVSAVTVAPDDAAGNGIPGSERVLRVETVRAALPPPPALPTWLGHRPPAPGAWVKTLDDEFNGGTLNTSVWSVSGANYYDKLTHWSRDDVLLGGGLVRLRYEKKSGPGNDDPAQPQTPYAAGYLDTYNKWTQCYGYFEARVKLPTAPGLWPAFWMMPDRGRAAGPEQWKQQDTGNGGMEFDIMEHLTRWGPYRYNIAMHWDGYGKDHKTIGCDRVYVRPDKDGFITCGLLWTPGSVVYYCNGREVLRWNNPRISEVPSDLMFTMPSGGWDNDPLVDSQLPDDFVVDYVRVWQRRDLMPGPPSQK